jgi:PKD repeat protein
MKQNKKRQLLILLGVWLCFSFSSIAQSGLSISWNGEVGCIDHEQQNTHDGKNPIPLEDIIDGPCIRVCENSIVTYTLSGNLDTIISTQWTVLGGTIIEQNSSFCIVKWGASGEGVFSFAITTEQGIIANSMCLEKIKSPKADFTIIAAQTVFLGEELTLPAYFVCKNQTLNFHNVSSTNGGSALIAYQWDFGDGTYSAAFEPTHTYTDNGEYSIYLTVSNECGCISRKRVQIKVKSDGFDILCPSTVCENQTATYSLPFDGLTICKDHFNWSVIGGHINETTATNGNITVLWDEVDDTGFGYVTFNPVGCELDCLLPTTIKIPVIKSRGTIIGNTTLCEGAEGIYKLPQWPSTDFHWEIVDDPQQTTAQLIVTDQRNEIVVRALQHGQIRLKATYENTLLHCGGIAEFTITISKINFITGLTTACIGTTGTFAAANEDSFNWTIKKNETLIATQLASNNITYTFATAGNYTVSVNNASTNSCSNMVKSVQILSSPQTSNLVDGKVLVCPNAPYEYSIHNPIPGVRYRWELVPAGSGTFLGAQIGNTVNIQFDVAATHQIYIYTESLNPIICPSAPKIITITTEQIKAEIKGDNDTQSTICANTVGQYKVVTQDTNDLYNDGETYEWSLVTADQWKGSITSGQGTQNISVLWNNVTTTTTATLHLDIRKCTLPLKSLDFIITIVPLPSITIQIANTSICSNAVAHFQIISNIPLDSSTQVTWNFDSSTSVTGSTSINHSFNSYNTTNIIRTVRASLTACGVTITAPPVVMTILPGPLATNSITEGGNSYCTLPIATTLTAATSGTSIQWYQTGTPPTALTGETSGTYSPTAFGGYYFVATNSSGCTTPSNIVFIKQISCAPPPTCTIPESYIAQNDASNDCGTITLSGPIVGPLYSAFWQVTGPNINSTFLLDTSFQGQVGEYQIFHTAVFPCNEGGTWKKETYKKVTIPYLPNFKYTASCNENSNFNLTVVDNSNFFNPVTDRTYEYYFFNGTNWSTTPVLTTPDGTIATNLAAGSYKIKLVLKGKLDGDEQPQCEKTIDIALSTLPSMNINVTNAPVKCHDTAVKFAVSSPQNGYTYLWSFDAGAENTLEEPSRVFNSSGNQPVSVVVTNKYGCTASLALPAPGVVIPPQCYTGTVASTPSPAMACKGDSVILTYAPTTQVCAAPQYTWMNGKDSIFLTTSDHISVQNNGFYWVQLKSPDNCIFNTPNRITPFFKIRPSLNLQTAGSYCEGDMVTASVLTEGTIITWTVDGVLQPWFVNQQSVTFGSLPLGNHTITATASLAAGDCEATASQIITVGSRPATPEITQQVVCPNEDPEMPFYHAILTAHSDVADVFNWSNGMTGEQILVTTGGPYQVRITHDGCSSMAQTDVPKNAEAFTWVIPTGCAAQCNKEGTGSLGMLIGPLLPLPYWAWLLNDTVVASGHDSFPANYPLNSSGSYTFAYSTSHCNFASPPFNYSLRSCPNCKIENAKLKDVKPITDLHYCAYGVTLEMSSYYSSPVSITISSVDDEVIILPSALPMLPETHAYTFTFIPINGYSGGPLHLMITAIDTEGKSCYYECTIILPDCTLQEGGGEQHKQGVDKATTQLSLYPNPAQDLLTIAFVGANQANRLEIYDLTGRLVASYTTNENQGEWEVSLATFAKGVYVVVLKENNQMVLQKKLVKE